MLKTLLGVWKYGTCCLIFQLGLLISWYQWYQMVKVTTATKSGKGKISLVLLY